MRTVRSLLVALGVFLMGAVALSPAVLAGERGHCRHGFRYAWVGPAYYGPHVHARAIYRYPMVVGGVVGYRPYVYAPLPRVVVGFHVRPHVHVRRVF